MILSKFFRPDIITGIEVTSSQIRLLEADTSKQPARILNFALIDLLSPHEGNITEQIKGILDQGRFEGKIANIAISHPSLIHRVITLPPMPSKEMDMVIEREVKSYAYEDEVVFDWQIIGAVQEEGTVKNEVLVVAAPLSEGNRYRSIVQNSALRCGIVTTIPLALFSALKFVRDGEKGAVLFFHLESERGYLLFVREGKWCFCRNFVQGEEFNEEQVLSEVKRSVYYFKRQFRGEELDRIITSGKVKGELDTIRENLEKNLGVKTEIFGPGYGTDLSMVRGRSRELQDVFPSLAVVLGLAAQNPRDKVIDLTPAKIKGREKEFKKRALAGFLAAAMVGGGTIAYIELSQRAKSLNDILQQRKATLERMKPFLDRATTLEEKRDRYEKSFSFLHQKKKRAPWLRALQVLSRIVPDDMVFESLEAERIEDGWRLNIKGKVVGADSWTVQKDFNRFYSRLTSSPMFSNFELMPLNITRLKEREGSGGRISYGVKGKSKLDFEIRCQLRNEMSGE